MKIFMLFLEKEDDHLLSIMVLSQFHKFFFHTSPVSVNNNAPGDNLKAWTTLDVILGTGKYGQ